jgi:transcriptional regulator with XRE-family HTH domain
MDVGTRLRIELAMHGKRPQEVANLAGLPLPTLSRILHGKQQPKPETLERIERAIRAPAAVVR